MTDRLLLHAAATEAAEINGRSLSGLAVPYGPVGFTSAGPIRFSQGSLTWAEVGRIKLLKQHDHERSLGFATALDDRPDGLRATFDIPPSPEGDTALAEAHDGRRDGLSVGVLLSEETVTELMQKLMDGDTTPTNAKGELVEISQVSIPAFTDSRIAGSKAAAAFDESAILTAVFSGGATEKKEANMPEATTPSVEAAAPVVEASAPEPTPVAPVMPAVAGGALRNPEADGSAAIYTFNGKGHSLIRDVLATSTRHDPSAKARLDEFAQALAEGSPAQVRAMTAAVDTRSNQSEVIPSPYRPDLLVSAIDKGRPFVSKMTVNSLTDATPFRLPTEGDFTAVGDHTEGQSSAAEGALTLGEVTVTPGAISGAYRFSRELADASNPAIDQIAVRAMVRDYARATEAKVAAALLAADGTATLNIDKVSEVRAEINNFYDVNFDNPSYFFLAPSYYATLLNDVDTTGRPMLASINPVNAVGQGGAGATGASVDSVELVKSASIAVNDGFLTNTDDVFVGESPLRLFRFEEVEGPGIIKIALWAYFAAKVTRNSGVVQLSSAAA